MTKVDKFNFWMRQVDADLYKRVGLESLDLPDVDYYNMFDCGFSPRRAATAAIKYGEDY